MLIATLVIALIVRLVGINHGFPFIYHPDEPTVIRTALEIRFNPNPHHFDWPHLYIYLNYFLYMVSAELRDLLGILGLRSILASVAPIIWNDHLIFYLITRIFSAVIGVTSIIPLYLWVKKLVNKKAGLFASSFLALAPFHVRHSHYALIDVPMLFFLLWSLFFSTSSPILCGLFLGLSASTKYNGVLGAIFITIYYIMTRRKFIDFIKTGVFTIVGFLIGTPFALLDFKTFIRTDGPQGALWQFINVGRVEFAEHIEQFFHALVSKLPDDLGYGTAAIFFTGVTLMFITMLKKKEVKKVLCLAVMTFLILIYYISGVVKDRSQYYMIIYPYFFLVAGWTLSGFVDRVKRLPFRFALMAALLIPSIIGSITSVTNLINKKSDTIYGGDRITQDEKTP